MTSKMDFLDRVMLQLSESNTKFDNTIAGVFYTAAPLDRTRVANVLKEKLLQFERFHSIPDLSAECKWTRAATLDMSYHLVEPLDFKGGKDQVLDFVAKLYQEKTDTTQPLWRFYLLKLDDGQGAMVSRIHHSIADGTTLVQVLFSLMDQDFVEALGSPRTVEKHPTPPWLRTLANPIQAIDRLYIWTKGILYGSAFAVLPGDSPICLKPSKGTALTGIKSIASTDPIPLDHFKQVKNAFKGTVNDVVVATITGAIRQYMKAHADPCLGTQPQVTLLFPFNLRMGKVDVTDPAQFGNQFTILPLNASVDTEDPLRLLQASKRECDDLKLSPISLVTLGINELSGKILPRDLYEKVTVNIFEKATGLFTNVPGPLTPVVLAGQHVDDLLFFVPALTGFTVSVMSYNGNITIGMLCDEATGIDAKEFTVCLHDEFYRLHAAMTSDDTTNNTAQPVPYYRWTRFIIGVAVLSVARVLPLFILVTLISFVYLTMTEKKTVTKAD